MITELSIVTMLLFCWMHQGPSLSVAQLVGQVSHHSIYMLVCTSPCRAFCWFSAAKPGGYVGNISRMSHGRIHVIADVSWRRARLRV